MTACAAQASPDDPAQQVTPIGADVLGSYSADDEQSRRVLQILQGSSRYLAGPWFDETYPAAEADAPVDLGGNKEANVRYPAMTAMTVATALSLDVYDPKDLPVEEATGRVVSLVRALATQHRANSSEPDAWGKQWQSALWAYYGGAAAWMVWDELAEPDRAAVVAMLTSEADVLTSGDDMYLTADANLDRGDREKLFSNGRDGRPVEGGEAGDSKSEENSWSAALLGLNAAMLPEAPGAPGWQERNNELLVAAAARPADLAAQEPLSGIQPSTWLQGSNIDDDGVVRNHQLIHPIYMVAFDQSLYQGAISALGGKCAPKAAQHNIPLVYQALVDRKFDDPASGAQKTIYTPGAPDVFYPEGNDWGSPAGFPFYFGNFDALVSLYGLDGEASVPASEWEALHNEAQLAMQARSTDGRTYLGPLEGPAAENTYKGREQRIGVMAAQTFLSVWMVRKSGGPTVCWE
ncbi:hypothetical protein [Pseudonocardia sp. HH130630-07]|uniref:hypothetical protein n=1 Tax=Pseudonocardia sp. HH130630-07 TaxID=1690815 RepID=UPI0012EAE685|nr:hypothetical protein [Pseudonocardia sp. HH130630-07]